MIILPFYPDTLQLSRERHLNRDTEDALLTVLIQLSILIGTLFSFWYTKQKIEKTSFGNLFKINFRGFFCGGAVGIILMLVYALIMITGNLISFSYLSINNIPELILVFIMVAISEEVIFRGYLLNKLQERVSVKMAVVISSLIFSLAHLGNPHFGTIGFINILLSGILMATLYLRSLNLWAPIGLHFTWNLTQAILGFAVSGHKDMGLLKLDHLSSHDYLTGGEFGIEGSILLTPIIVVSILLPKPYVLFTKNHKP